MKKLELNKTEVLVITGVAIVFFCLTFGFGYFFGRYEQIVINKSLLQEIPDVNCGLTELVDD